MSKRENLIRAIKGGDASAVTGMAPAEAYELLGDVPGKDKLFQDFRQLLVVAQATLAKKEKVQQTEQDEKVITGIPGFLDFEVSIPSEKQRQVNKALSEIMSETRPYAVNGKGELVNADNQKSYNIFQNAVLTNERTGQEVGQSKRLEYIRDVVKASKLEAISNLLHENKGAISEIVVNSERRKGFAKDFSQRVTKILNRNADDLVKQANADNLLKSMKTGKKIAAVDGSKPFMVSSAVAYASLIGKVKNIDKAITNSWIATKIRNFEDKLAKENKLASFAWTLGSNLLVTGAVGAATGFVGLAALGGVRYYLEVKKQKRLYEKAKTEGLVKEATFAKYKENNRRVRHAIRNKAIFGGLGAGFAAIGIIDAAVKAGEFSMDAVAQSSGLLGASMQGKLQGLNSSSLFNMDKVWENVTTNVANFKANVLSNITTRGAVYGGTSAMLGFQAAQGEWQAGNHRGAILAGLGSFGGAALSIAGVNLIKDHDGYVSSMGGADLSTVELKGGSRVAYAGMFGINGGDDNVIAPEDKTVILPNGTSVTVGIHTDLSQDIQVAAADESVTPAVGTTVARERFIVEESTGKSKATVTTEYRKGSGAAVVTGSDNFNPNKIGDESLTLQDQNRIALRNTQVFSKADLERAYAAADAGELNGKPVEMSKELYMYKLRQLVAMAPYAEKQAIELMTLEIKCEATLTQEEIAIVQKALDRVDVKGNVRGVVGTTNNVITKINLDVECEERKGRFVYDYEKPGGKVVTHPATIELKQEQAVNVKVNVIVDGQVQAETRSWNAADSSAAPVVTNRETILEQREYEPVDIVNPKTNKPNYSYNGHDDYQRRQGEEFIRESFSNAEVVEDAGKTVTFRTSGSEAATTSSVSAGELYERTYDAKDIINQKTGRPNYSYSGQDDYQNRQGGRFIDETFSGQTPVKNTGKVVTFLSKLSGKASGGVEH